MAASGVPQLTEIDVERINVREPDGRLRMVLSGADRAPDPLIGGATAQRQGGNKAGLIFYNDVGDECGGLVFGSDEGRAGAEQGRAGAGLLFDRLRQDQVVGLTYNESAGSYRAGLTVWDRPEAPLAEVRGRYEEFQQLQGAARETALARMRADGIASATRVFTGRERDGNAVVELADSDQRVRLRLVVEAKGAARIEFLDEAGQVVRSIP
jgi:hypothetical protein